MVCFVDSLVVAEFPVVSLYALLARWFCLLEIWVHFFAVVASFQVLEFRLIERVNVNGFFLNHDEEQFPNLKYLIGGLPVISDFIFP